MTQVQAQAVASAVINAGYDVKVHLRGDGTWTVIATATPFSVPAAAAVNLATAQGVNANIAEVEFS